MRITKLTIHSLFILLALTIANQVSAATEFISVVDTGGAGDYSTLSAWQLNNHVDLTAATTLVFSYDASSGTIADGDPVSTDGGASTATLVHETATQILLSGISGSFDDNDVVTDGTNTVTLSNAGDSAISVASCQGSDADTAAVTIEGWDTSDTNYIKVYTTTANRHDGKWSDTKYRLTLSSTALTISESYVTIEGLQIHGTNASGSNNQIYSNSVLSDILIDSCILRGNGNTAFGSNVGITLGGISDGSSWKVINSIFYDQKSYGIHESYSTGTTLEVYNCVFYNIFGTGILQCRSTLTVKNTAVFNTSDDFFDDNGGLTIDYCASDDGDGDHAVTPSDWSTVFEDYANGDFHLKSTDTDLKDAGTDLTAQGFTDDIDGQTRDQNSNGWDIGADEAAEKIYRSVGPSASSYLERGIDGSGNDLNISGSTATFASDLGNDVGVGDAIQYDTAGAAADPIDAICFIHGRTDETHYTVKNSLGGAPTATIADQDWDIFRSYDSLSHAESGDENDAINDTVETFENWAAGKDIVTSNEQWNIACYNGQGDAADQTAVTIQDWTTGAQNYIKIYTPTEITEVGETQRHSGVWSDGKYRLGFSDAYDYVIDCQVNYARFEGLQMHNSNANGNGFGYKGTGELYFSHNILQGSVRVDVHNSLHLSTMGASTVKIWNNIIYNSHTGIVYAYGTNGSTFIIYNNLIVDTASAGIRIRDNTVGDHSAYLKNNLVFNTSDDYNLTAFTTRDYDHNMGEDNDSGSQTNYVQTTQAGTTIFKDYNADDFHLSSSNDAKDAGADLSSDANLSFSDDIDGDSRVSPYWDIGADEYPAKQKAKFKGNIKFKGEIRFK